MNAVVLEPHNDDCVLFSAFNALRTSAHVVTVLRSHVQEVRPTHGVAITAEEREAETEFAMRVLGLTHEQWDVPDFRPDWDAVREKLEALRDVDHVFAPAVEEDGHEHHNVIGGLAIEVFGADRVTHYLTYTNGRARSTWGEPVEPGPGMVQKKLRALACYDSQIEHPSTGHHFLAAQWEFVANGNRL